MKKRFVFPRAGFLKFLLVVLASPFLALSQTEDPHQAADGTVTVLSVNGEPVSVDEYKLVMEGRTAEVFNYFHGKGLEDRLGYWKDDGTAENPIVRLRSVITGEFRQIKTIQSLAKKEGVIKDISFTAFQEGLSKENARRRKAVENKEVIYGPRQYQAYRYYYFQLTDLKQAVFEAFSKEPENAIPEPAIEAFYNANKSDVDDKPLSEVRDQIARALQKKNYEKWIETLTAQAKVEVNEAVLAGIAPRHDP